MTDLTEDTHKVTQVTFSPSHLPVAVVAGVGSQHAADLHVGEPLLQHFHHIPNAQLSTHRHPVEDLEGRKTTGMEG